jgi:hypothetical protein
MSDIHKSSGRDELHRPSANLSTFYKTKNRRWV